MRLARNVHDAAKAAPTRTSITCMQVSRFFLLVLPLCLAQVRGANIIDTIYGVGAGSFELPGHAASLFATYQAGSTAITGWTVNTVNVDWVKNTVWNASQGSYSIDMNGTNLPNGTPSSPGGLHTVIPTTTGSVYRVTFDIAGFVSAGNAINPKTMSVTAGGVTLPFSLTTTNIYPGALTLPLVLNWQSRTFDFTATGPSSVVSFLSTVTNGDGSAMILDNVVIEAVPEPSALALLGFGALGLVLRRRR
jgi:choice-of-anchor C domain-containing protein